MHNVVSIGKHKFPKDVYPIFYPAEHVEKATWLVCGKCGYNEKAKFFVYVEEAHCFEPVCNCGVPSFMLA